MANVTLQKTVTKDDQSFQVVVEYDPLTNTVPRIIDIFLTCKGLLIDAGEILQHLFGSHIDKIIDETDWLELHRGYLEQPELELGNINENFHGAFTHLYLKP